jgi:tripartite-type tricarboxylate transporter receptor subunit TctC
MPSALQLMKAGRLKALAVTSSKRSRVALELPTISEAGLKDYDESTWNGVFAPARAPASIVEKLNSELEAILKTPLTRDRLASEGAEPAWIRPEEFAAMIRNEVAKWAKVVSQAGIQPE